MSLTGGVWSAGHTTYTASYSVADAGVDLTDVTVDVTGAKDANGNDQAGLHAAGGVQHRHAEPDGGERDGERRLITDADAVTDTFSVAVVFDQAMKADGSAIRR